MITTSVDAGVATILLDRAPKRNALAPRMLEMLIEAVEGPAADARAIVLGGVGECFCAGFDLTLCRDDETVLESLLVRLSLAVRTLRRAEAAVVVAAHGAAIAGGCALLGGGDIVVTDAAARLGYPVVKLGISPGVSAPTLRMLCGDGAMRERMLDPALIDGRAALRIGLAHECVDEPGRVLDRATQIARDLAAKPPDGLRATKRWLNEIDGSDADEWFNFALGTSLSVVDSDEARERLAALWSR